MNQIESGYVKQIENDILIDSQDQFWKIDFQEGLKLIQIEQKIKDFELVHIDHLFDNFKQQNKYILIERNFEKKSYIVKIGQLLDQKENNILIQSPEKYITQQYKVIESRNLLIATYYRQIPEILLNQLQEQNDNSLDKNELYNNIVLFYEFNTGKEITLNDQIECCQSLIPQQIEYLERCQILIICSNTIADINRIKNLQDDYVDISAQISAYKLEFIDNNTNCQFIKNVDLDRGKIADIQSFEYFGGGYYIAVAIDNYIQIYKVNQDFKKQSDEILLPVNKIESQINIYKLNIQKFEKFENKILYQYFELLVADIMKSFTVYIIQNDNPKEEKPEQFEKNALGNILTFRKQVRNIQLKYQFPLGQWCTSMQSILIDNQHYYFISFFDQNLVILKAPQIGDYYQIKSIQQQLQIVASSQIGEQINTINKLYLQKKQFSQIDFLKEPSQIFISNQYIFDNQTLNERVSTSFFDKDVKFECQLAAASNLHSQESLIFSSSEGNVYKCHFIKDNKIQKILFALQQAMSEQMNFETLMSKYALTQLKSRYDDKIAFDQRLMQGYYDGDNNKTSQMKNKNLQEFLNLNSKQDQQNFIHNDMKYIDFLFQKKSLFEGQDSKVVQNNFIYADFISQLIEMNDKVQGKIVDRMNELITFEKDIQKGGISKGLDVREVIGLVAYATQHLIQ